MFVLRLSLYHSLSDNVDRIINSEATDLNNNYVKESVEKNYCESLKKFQFGNFSSNSNNY